MNEPNEPKKAGFTATIPLLSRIMHDYLRPYWRHVGLALLLMAVSGAMTATLAKQMEPIINDIFFAKDQAMIIPIALVVFIAFVLRGASTYGHSVLMNWTGQKIVSDIQKHLYAHLLNADLAFFHSSRIGELITRMTNDVTMMRIAVADAITALGKNVLTLIFLIGVMFYQDWQLAIGAFIVFPISAVIVASLGRKLRKVAQKTQNHWGLLTSLATEMFQGIRQVKAYGMEAYETRRASQLIDHLFHLIVKGFRVTALSSPIGEVLSGAAIITIIIYGGNRVMVGTSTPGELFSFITAFLLAYEPMKKLANVNAVLQTGLASSERVFQLIDMQPAIADHPRAQTLILQQPTIQFDNVSFAYGDANDALTDVTIDVPAGKKVALVGPSGAGKSTLLNLVPRFYDVQDGAVRIDGHDVRHLTLQSLRATMALVSQDIAIFDDTVAANIAYGRQGANEAEIIAAARAAFAHDFIMALPNGYQTRLGEQGISLSGGQRQRLAIARAIIRNAPILLLDEATSNLDAESENAIAAALKTLQQGRTTLVIAHRLSTIMDADIIYVMDKGRVVESGTHNELHQNDGLYSKLYHLQFAAEHANRLDNAA